MTTVLLTKQAKKSLFKLPVAGQRKISKAIDKLIRNSMGGEKLKGEFERQYKLAVWPYRIIYIFSSEENLATIVEIGHKQGIYK